MIYKKIILLLTLAVFNIAFSQTQGEIVYRASLNKASFEKKDKKNRFHQKLTKILKDQKDKYCLLVFNNKESVFERKKEMINDSESKFDFTSTYVGNGVYYYNLSIKESLIQKEVLGDNFIIVNSPKYKWNLSQERRKIGEYNCYKATTTKKITNIRGKEFNKNVTVWYTLDVPIKFGIKDYHGLPGAIIALEEEKITYLATKVVLKSDKVNIIKPTKGKKITQKQFDEYLLKNFKNI
ncbi:GLPGLI family protein [Tenacibaculum ovolyticum]|uniref:GLPGLI family protein n=1 Tax=Tenacibaculum ovolyticum TaxID=104270 RepID=UPI000403BCB5|nr:GLPGLI family protein [Tenacibaculum ovolyticum]